MDAVTRQRLAQVADFTHGGALEQFIDELISTRDVEWNRAIGYEMSSWVLSPEEARGWLEKDRCSSRAQCCGLEATARSYPLVKRGGSQNV
jgi:hypothetical protein